MHESDVLDGLSALVEQSLLRQTEDAYGEPRYSMLETIREYALERLDASSDGEAVRPSHASYFLALAEAIVPKLGGPDAAGFQRLLSERDNLRSALRWSVDHAEPELGMRLIG